MSLVFMRTNTSMGARTVVFSVREVDAHLICANARVDHTTDTPPIMILDDRGPYNTVPQIVALRKKQAAKEAAAAARKKARDQKAMLKDSNVTALATKGIAHVRHGGRVQRDD